MYFCSFLIHLLFLIELIWLVTGTSIDLGNLFLKEDFSDVVFHIGDVQLPAHRLVLAQRSPVLNDIVSNTTSGKKAITLTDTLLDAFKPFLKYIYTGAINFNTLNVDTIFAVNQLAVKYNVSSLEELTVKHIKSINITDNMFNILNEAAKIEQETLIVHCLRHVKANSGEVMTSDSFNKLSVKALTRLFKDNTLRATHWDVFRVFVRWMKVNPTESQHFPSILKHIDLRTMAIDGIVSAIRPMKLISADALLDIVWEQSKVFEYPVDNVLSAYSDAKVVHGGPSTFFTVPIKNNSLYHRIDRGSDGILINLGRMYKLNHLVMELADGDKSYQIDVSEDNVIWTRVIDYSTYTCRSVQKLYFKVCVARFIRISGTSPADGIFKITHLEAYYTTQPLAFDPITNIVIPKHNVASNTKNAIVIEGTEPDIMLNGDLVSRAGTWRYANTGPITVQLPQPYILETMNMMLDDDGLYSYNMEISTDKKNWTRVFSEENVNYWRPIKFTKRPVVFIRINGTYKSSGTWFMIRHLECPAILKVKAQN